MSQNLSCGFGFGSGGGGAAGAITGAGTPPKVPKFTGATAIGDSQISDDGVTVFIGASATSANANFEVNSTTQGALFPRLTTAERNLIVVGGSDNSLFIFNTSIQQYQYYDSVLVAWVTIHSSGAGSSSWSDVLSNGALSGGTSPELSDGDVLKAENGLSQLNLRTGVNSNFSLSSDAGTLAKSWYVGSTTSQSSGFSTNKSETTASGWDWIDNVTNRMTLTTAGLLGIGVAPTARVHIQGVGSTSATSSLFVQNLAATKLFEIKDDGTSSLGSGTGLSTSMLDIEVPATSLNPLTLYENKVGGAVNGDNYGLGFYFNDSLGARTLGGEIIARVNGAPTAGDVNMDMTLNGDLKVQSNNRVLITPAALTKAGVAHLEVRGLAATTPNVSLLLTGNGATASQTIIWAKSSTNNLFILDGEGKAFHNVDNLATGDFVMEGVSDANMFYADASTNRVGFGIAAPTAKVHIFGAGATSATTTALFENSSSTNILTLRDDIIAIVGSPIAPTGTIMFSAEGGINTEDAFYLDNTHILSRSGGGSGTIALGRNAIPNVTGTLNTALGEGAGLGMTTGIRNVFAGNDCWFPLTGASSYNVGMGMALGATWTLGTGNIVMGASAGFNVTSGNQNLILGRTAGATTSGAYSNSIALGFQARFDSDNQLVMGSNSSYIEEMWFGGGIEDTDVDFTSIDHRYTNITAGTVNKSTEYNIIWNAGQGTGTGVGSDFIWNLAPAGTTGSAVNALVEALRITSSGLVGIGTAVPTAFLHIKAGTATASTAPMKFTTGTLNTSAESGAMEYASDFFYLSTNSIRTSISTYGRTVVTTATYTVLVTDRILGVTRTSTGVCTINLPSAALYPSGYEITVKDEGLNATAFNITIDASAAQTIDGALTAIINTDADSLTLYSNGVDSWFIK